MKSFAEEGDLGAIATFTVGAAAAGRTEEFVFSPDATATDPERLYQRVSFVLTMSDATVAAPGDTAMRAVADDSGGTGLINIPISGVYFRPAAGGPREYRKTPSGEYEVVNGEVGEYIVEVESDFVADLTDSGGDIQREYDRVSIQIQNAGAGNIVIDASTIVAYKGRQQGVGHIAPQIV
jgi:hypothetical protein